MNTQDFEELQALIGTAAGEVESEYTAEELEELREIEAEEAKEDAAVLAQPTGFEDLDELLAESREAISKAAEIKAAKKKLSMKSSLMDATERSFIEAKVAEWEARHTWKTIELVAVFRRQSCVCGCSGKTFSHFMHHQQHRTDSFAQRWVSAACSVPLSSDADLPRSIAYTDSVVAICTHCAQLEGFDLTAPTSLSWQVGVNGGYLDGSL